MIKNSAPDNLAYPNSQVLKEVQFCAGPEDRKSLTTTDTGTGNYWQQQFSGPEIEKVPENLGNLRLLITDDLNK